MHVWLGAGSRGSERPGQNPLPGDYAKVVACTSCGECLEKYCGYGFLSDKEGRPILMSLLGNMDVEASDQTQLDLRISVDLRSIEVEKVTGTKALEKD
ncbi:hypothetical protein ANCCEY_03215 [Ancylostoma ceylanicum]|uniref:Uncharacterized protein n=1 Tax=Ancylostoma ceylanicum TaxID=53326 RepID=A0A0D6M5L6_9BILA|nr:hypothetical protein ANCCEY_03215 [Ancylostoma ceylanicum]